MEAVKTIATTLIQNKKDTLQGGPSDSDSLMEKIDNFAF